MTNTTNTTESTTVAAPNEVAAAIGQVSLTEGMAPPQAALQLGRGGAAASKHAKSDKAESASDLTKKAEAPKKKKGDDDDYAIDEE
mmetsp:Transcript_35324/g.73557  ORF Transcript_35324/g.73557 Transcript_35324/m.73557 type:complete len:86 (+) Transcript_35324:146-403(+)|eukprot:CAMPEP_0172471916 /NCGR_PEP_ID=MMETSP1065-20121228/68065_1 /TAXON_ID=265537 /ORGANISM="Amphiprora paludosa, Strain CCMP125" /LENGTH=85 /DNA_ID=CAMNT_0013230031 /DNA_START=131 /DNA_END=388 /DNA_ORIENTATION=-